MKKGPQAIAEGLFSFAGNPIECPFGALVAHLEN
jgi:hypothetical protein